MPEIQFADKDHTLPSSDVRRKFRDIDANEIKTIVNQIGTANRGWIDGSINRYPDPDAVGASDADLGSGEDGRILKGNNWYYDGPVVVDDGSGLGAQPFPHKTKAEAIEDDPGQDPEKWKLS